MRCLSIIIFLFLSSNIYSEESLLIREREFNNIHVIVQSKVYCEEFTKSFLVGEQVAKIAYDIHYFEPVYIVVHYSANNNFDSISAKWDINFTSNILNQSYKNKVLKIENHTRNVDVKKYINFIFLTLLKAQKDKNHNESIFDSGITPVNDYVKYGIDTLKYISCKLDNKVKVEQRVYSRFRGIVKSKLSINYYWQDNKFYIYDHCLKTDSIILLTDNIYLIYKFSENSYFIFDSPSSFYIVKKRSEKFYISEKLLIETISDDIRVNQINYYLYELSYCNSGHGFSYLLNINKKAIIDKSNIDCFY